MQAVFHVLIKQSDYHRIYKVINSLLLNENADPATASMYFSTFGAFILREHFKIKATPKCGLAAFNLGGQVVLFADHREDGYVTGSGENFHCWIEAEGWLIDFMAPCFKDSASHLNLEARMLQRPLSEMCTDINDVKLSGDFYLLSEDEAAKRRFADWHKRPMIGDLATIAAQWFRKSPKAMSKNITVSDHTGKQNIVNLTGHALSGTW